jgi:hypothetical protein
VLSLNPHSVEEIAPDAMFFLRLRNAALMTIGNQFGFDF